MIELEIDGRKVSAESGASILEIAIKHTLVKLNSTQVLF